MLSLAIVSLLNSYLHHIVLGIVCDPLPARFIPSLHYAAKTCLGSCKILLRTCNVATLLLPLGLPIERGCTIIIDIQRKPCAKWFLHLLRNHHSLIQEKINLLKLVLKDTQVTIIEKKACLYLRLYYMQTKSVTSLKEFFGFLITAHERQSVGMAGKGI